MNIYPIPDYNPKPLFDQNNNIVWHIHEDTFAATIEPETIEISEDELDTLTRLIRAVDMSSDSSDSDYSQVEPPAVDNSDTDMTDSDTDN